MNIIGCIASNKNSKAIDLQKQFIKKYSKNIVFFNKINEIHENNNIKKLIVLGGDGFMIRVLHEILKHNLSIGIYGINCGHLGFLLNDFNHTSVDLLEKIETSTQVDLHPLQIELKTRDEKIHKIFAINEISILRQTYQSIHIDVFINDILRVGNLSGDGILIATASGSAAYNKSAGGIIIPIQSEMLCLTAINAFRPKAWRSAILPDSVIFKLKMRYKEDRPALACADFQQYYFVDEIISYINKGIKYSLLFDHESNIKEKIMREQFSFCG